MTISELINELQNLLNREDVEHDAPVVIVGMAEQFDISAIYAEYDGPGVLIEMGDCQS